MPEATDLDPLRPVRDLLGVESATLIDVLRRRAETEPDRFFLAWQDQRWSYGEAWSFALRLANGLRERAGVVPGDRVASYLANGPEALFITLATYACGAVYVPLNRELKSSTIGELLARTDPKVFVADADAGDVLSAAPPHQLYVVGDGDEVHQSFDDLEHAQEGDPVMPRPGDPAAIWYTSGSTGRAKAVLEPHGFFVSSIAVYIDAYRMTADDIFHCWLPLCYGAAHLDVMGTAVLAGAGIALFPTYSASRFWTEVRDFNCTITVAFPIVLNTLLSRPEQPDDADNPLRVFITAGLDPAVKSAIKERFDADALNAYGMNEADNVALEVIGGNAPPGSCGSVNPLYEIAILGEEDEQLPAGEVGQIGMRPRVPHAMFLRYNDDPALTVEAWRNLWFHTGDMGYMDDEGHLFFAARSKDRIRRRGKNMTAVEIEVQLNAHPGVIESAVVAVPADLGEDEIKAAIAVGTASAFDVEEFERWCREQMPKYMVPRFLEVLDDLPRLAAGKADKERLRSMSSGTIELHDRR